MKPTKNGYKSVIFDLNNYKLIVIIPMFSKYLKLSLKSGVCFLDNNKHTWFISVQTYNFKFVRFIKGIRLRNDLNTKLKDNE